MAMTDPFWMIMLLQRLVDEYIVWDRAAEIDFVAPGRGRVIAEFQLEASRVESIRALAANGERHLEWFECLVRADDDSVVARVRQQVYVRRKRASTGAAPP